MLKEREYDSDCISMPKHSSTKFAADSKALMADSAWNCTVDSRGQVDSPYLERNPG